MPDDGIGDAYSFLQVLQLVVLVNVAVARLMQCAGDGSNKGKIFVSLDVFVECLVEKMRRHDFRISTILLRRIRRFG
jgi:hypothetical protein